MLQYADGGFRVSNIDLETQYSENLFVSLKLLEPQIINLDDEEVLFTSSGDYDIPKEYYEQGVQAFLTYSKLQG